MEMQIVDSFIQSMSKINEDIDAAGKVITCKGAVAWGPKKPLVLEEVEVDPPQSMEVHIRITHTSVCHSDVSVWMMEDEKFWANPRILGHEAAGLFITSNKQVAEGARLRGATKIIGIDTNPTKFGKAKVLGVKEFINPKEESKPIDQIIHNMTNGGVDYAFECVENVDTMYQAFQSVHHGWGMVVLLGVDVSGKMINFLPMDSFYGRKIDGSTFGGFKGKSQLFELIGKCIKKEVRVNEFITHNIEFPDINKAFEMLLDGKSL